MAADRHDVDERSNQVIEQYPVDVRDFSSQYGNDGSISYTAINLVGKPSVYPKYGDFTDTYVTRTYGIWWTKAPFAGKPFVSSLPVSHHVCSQDFIELKYETKVYPTEIRIYETYNPGAVVRILAWNEDQAFWALLWKGPPQKVPHEAARMFCPPLRRVYFQTDHIRLELHHKHLSYYSELDCVELVGSFLPLLPGGDGTFIFPTSQDRMHFIQNLAALHIFPRMRDVGTHDAYFNILPEEVLHLIFKHLDLASLCLAAQVSKMFQKHCYDSVLYTELNLQPFWSKVDDNGLNGLKKRCTTLQRLNLSWCGGQSRLTSSGFVHFVDCCGKHLTCLRLNSCPFVSNECLKAVADTCLFLQDLELRSCHQAQIDHLGFKQIARMSELQRLDLYRTSVDQNSVITLIRYCTKLKHLGLGGCSLIANYDDVAAEIGKNLRSLQSLDLWRAKSLTASGVRVLANGCRSLADIDLGWCRDVDVSSGCIRDLVQKCHHLQKLFLTAIRTVGDAELIAIATCCKDLKQLDILGTREVTSEAVYRLLVHCKQLKFFDVSFCEQIDQQSIAHWRELFPHVDLKRSG